MTFFLPAEQDLFVDLRPRPPLRKGSAAARRMMTKKDVPSLTSPPHLTVPVSQADRQTPRAKRPRLTPAPRLSHAQPDDTDALYEKHASYERDASYADQDWKDGNATRRAGKDEVGAMISAAVRDGVSRDQARLAIDIVRTFLDSKEARARELRRLMIERIKRMCCEGPAADGRDYVPRIAADDGGSSVDEIISDSDTVYIRKGHFAAVARRQTAFGGEKPRDAQGRKAPAEQRLLTVQTTTHPVLMKRARSPYLIRVAAHVRDNGEVVGTGVQYSVVQRESDVLALIRDPCSRCPTVRDVMRLAETHAVPSSRAYRGYAVVRFMTGMLVMGKLSPRLALGCPVQPVRVDR